MKKIKDHYLRNFASALLLIIAIYVLGILFWDQISSVLKVIPLVKDIYQIILLELERKSVLGLALITFFGSLFLIGYPGEVLFLVYARLGYSILYISLIMIFLSMLGQAINYGIGFFIEKKILEKYVKKNKKEYLNSLKRYDMTFIIVLNILPLPSDILSLLLGMVKYDFKKAMLFSIIGKILKFLFLAILFALSNI